MVELRGIEVSMYLVAVQWLTPWRPGEIPSKIPSDVCGRGGARVCWAKGTEGIRMIPNSGIELGGRSRVMNR